MKKRRKEYHYKEEDMEKQKQSLIYSLFYAKRRKWKEKQERNEGIIQEIKER